MGFSQQPGGSSQQSWRAAVVVVMVVVATCFLARHIFLLRFDFASVLVRVGLVLRRFWFCVGLVSRRF